MNISDWMLAEVKAWGLKPATVTGDRRYASKQNLNVLKDKGFCGLFALEGNRLELKMNLDYSQNSQWKSPSLVIKTISETAQY